MINFIKNLKTITYNLFKIEMINIKYQIMMIKNIIVLNIYNLMKTMNL